ncbi:MAG: hypothetical protein O7C58_07040 [Rickettsia endosymbiont of Ixodes persulcatus]|nr:hypothetical protein [Rickettsia endosymbiont of Ixodes persulcatus]
MLCGIVNKKYLSSEITTLIIDVTDNTSKKHLLDKAIKNARKMTSLNPTFDLVHANIKYFSNVQGKTNVSNQNQKVGERCLF